MEYYDRYIGDKPGITIDRTENFDENVIQVVFGNDNGSGWHPSMATPPAAGMNLAAPNIQLQPAPGTPTQLALGTPGTPTQLVSSTPGTPGTPTQLALGTPETPTQLATGTQMFGGKTTNKHKHKKHKSKQSKKIKCKNNKTKKNKNNTS